MPFLPSLPLSLESDLLATFFDVFPGITALEASLSCTTSLNWPSESLTKDPGHSLGSFNGKAGWLWSGLSFLGLIERIFYWKSFISFRRHSSASLCGFSNSHSSPCLSAAFFSSNKACKGAISLLSCLLGFRVSEEEERVKMTAVGGDCSLPCVFAWSQRIGCRGQLYGRILSFRA